MPTVILPSVPCSIAHRMPAATTKSNLILTNCYCHLLEFRPQEGGRGKEMKERRERRERRGGEKERRRTLQLPVHS